VDERRLVRRELRYALRVVVVLVIAGAVILALVSQVGHLPHIHWRIRPAWLLLAVVGFVILQLIHAQLWGLILRWLGYPLPGPRARAIWSTSLLARYVPTNLLMVVVRITSAERAGIPKRVTAASVVYEIPLTVAGSLALGAYFVVVLPSLAHQPLRFAVVAAPVLLVLLLHPRLFAPMAQFLLTRMGREPLPTRLGFSRVLALGALYVGSFVVAGLATYAFARTLYAVPAAHAATVVGAFSVGYVASIVGFMLPAGIGAREAAFTAALAPVLPASVALAVAVGVRLVQIPIEIAYALVTPLLARRSDPSPRRKASTSASDSGVPIS